MASLDEVLGQVASKGSAVISKLQQVCTLVTLRFHAWRGGDAADEANVSVSGVELHSSTRLSSPRWCLLPKKWKDTFSSLEAKARSTLNFYSVKSPVRGSRFVPLEKAEELFTKLSVIRVDLATQAEEFCSEKNYNAMLEELKTELKEAYEAASRHIPSRDRLRGKYGMDWFVIPIGEPGTALTENPSMYIREARTTLNKVVMESVEAMVREPRQRLLDAVQSLVEQTTRDKRRIRNDTLNNVRSAFEEFRNWAFLSDAQTMEALEKAEESLLGVEAKQVNANAEVSNGLALALGALKGSLLDEAATVEGFNKFRRSVNL